MSTLKFLVLSEEENDLIDKEYKCIIDLIPPKNIPIEQRMELNGKIRDLLPKVSNCSLAYLMVNKKHQLSRKEFCNRLNGNNFTFREICIILDRLWVGQSDFHKLLLELANKLSLLANTISREEMINYAEIFSWEEIGQDFEIPFTAIIQRNDAEDILAELAEREPLCFKQWYERFKNDNR